MSEEGSSEWLGQAFALLLVGGLIGLVVWFARGYDPESEVGFVGDASADASGEAADAAEPDAGAVAEPDPVVDHLHTALFGARVDDNAGLPLEIGQGCVLRVTLRPTLEVTRVRLHCDSQIYESPRYDTAIGEVREASGDVGPIYAVRYTSPDDASRRLSVDTSRGAILVMEGDSRARLTVDAWSAARPGESFTDAAPPPEPPSSRDETCALATRYSGGVLTATEELAPLTITLPAGGSARLDLFDARAEAVEGFEMSCAARALDIAGERSRYSGRLGPGGRSIVGRVDLDGESGLFWLIADAEGSSDEAGP